MARIKFTFKRLRMDLDEGAGSEDDEFNFESDDEQEVANTAAAVSAVKLPGDKLSAADAQQQNIFKDVDETLLQSSDKRQRDVGSWETQGQWKMPRLRSIEVQSRAGTGIKHWGAMPGRTESAQRQVRNPVSRLAASVREKRGAVGLSKYSSPAASSARIRENGAEPKRTPSTQATRARVAGRPKLLVMRGDPTDWSTAAIVSDTNSLLHHNSDLAATIVRKGGLEIQRQSTAWVYHKGEVPVGSAMWTTAGKLSSRFIIYTVGPDVSRHRWPTPRHQLDLRRAVRSALNVADDLGVTSVAIPAICTGVSRYPKYLAAREIVTECLKFCNDSPTTTLRLIALMNEDEVTTSIFVQAMKDARQQRQVEQQWASIVAIRESVQTFEVLLDGSSDDSSATSEMERAGEQKDTPASLASLNCSSWTV